MACHKLVFVGVLLLWPEWLIHAQTVAPTGILSLEEAAGLALEHNPTLRVFPWDVRAAEARALQASLWPNPELSFEAEEVRLSDGPEERTRDGSFSPAGVSLERERTNGAPSGFREAEFTFRVSQLFQLGGKRKKAVAVAERERDAAEWEYEIGRTNVLRDVARAYIAVLAAQERVSERRQILGLAETVEKTIGTRVEAGKVSPIEQTRASVQSTSARIELNRASRELERARVALSATWGSTEPEFEKVSGELHGAPVLPGIDSLLARSTTNPDI